MRTPLTHNVLSAITHQRYQTGILAIEPSAVEYITSHKGTRWAQLINSPGLEPRLYMFDICRRQSIHEVQRTPLPPRRATTLEGKLELQLGPKRIPEDPQMAPEDPRGTQRTAEVPQKTPDNPQMTPRGPPEAPLRTPEDPRGSSEDPRGSSKVPRIQ